MKKEHSQKQRPRAGVKSCPITLGKVGTRIDWSNLAQRWTEAFGTPLPQLRVFGPPLVLSKPQLKALGFFYASGDKIPPRVDLNQ